jgi:hypothetical protein
VITSGTPLGKEKKDMTQEKKITMRIREAFKYEYELIVIFTYKR